MTVESDEFRELERSLSAWEWLVATMLGTGLSADEIGACLDRENVNFNDHGASACRKAVLQHGPSILLAREGNERMN